MLYQPEIYMSEKLTREQVEHIVKSARLQIQRPDLIKLNVAVPGTGVLWIRDIKLLRTPLE